ncbi:MAG: hypothetical protein M1294_00715 [Firmicutes bacterium]|jgi:hypothetical protein|uniref:Uncharacterized protein n=1 Tax=Sulfobacillus benefaciens TaxID=453960 RepID=A0A2T2XAG1_9FIRM|nr:hypothetical protein [Bacillota bacterium]MCL5014367.1 hypothetical protein [Bacillota bacterium]PSR31472.1 MAG: hypothetical protein C7B43_01890 [Sulfobacillus benefaciens]HBQ96117.1 hypothetical protein [Sulfobacillus sp.]
MAESEGMSFEILAAGIRDIRHDVPLLLSVLAKKLETGLPDRVRVARHSGLFSRDNSINSITVDFENVRYVIKHKAGRLETLRQKVVHDVVLKTDAINFDDWIEEVLRHLMQESDQNENVRNMLDRFLTS